MSFLLLLVILRIVLMDFTIFAFIKTLVAIFGHAIQPLKHRTLSLPINPECLLVLIVLIVVAYYGCSMDIILYYFLLVYEMK
jgi:hypothetical protein